MAQIVIRTDNIEESELWITRDIIHIPRIGESLYINYTLYNVVDVRYLYDENGTNNYSIIIFANKL